MDITLKNKELILDIVNKRISIQDEESRQLVDCFNKSRDILFRTQIDYQEILEKLNPNNYI